MWFCLSVSVKTSKPQSGSIIHPTLLFPALGMVWDPLAEGIPRQPGLPRHPGDAEPGPGSPGSGVPLAPCVPRFAWGFGISRVAGDPRGARGLLRAPRSAHLWCHSKEGLFFCRLLPRNLLHHHGNSLICRPRAFPLQQRNQQWRESAASPAQPRPENTPQNQPGLKLTAFTAGSKA